MNKFNYQKFGSWIGSVLQSNSGTIVGGLSMIGLALLCRKLNIPYQVLTDPYYGTRSKIHPVDDSRDDFSLVYLPNDAIEASISAIYDGAVHADFDSQRTAAVREIVSILAARKNDISDATKTYAITTLRMISKKMDFDSGRKTITQYISKIAKGEF